MKRKLLVALVVGACLATAAWFAHDQLSPQRLVAQEDALRESVEQRPILAFVAGLTAYTLLSFLPALTGKALVVGWVFGFLPALVIINFGMTFTALVSFTISRFLFRRYVHQRHAELLEKIDAGLREEGAYYLLSMRLLRFPYTLLNYSLGATNVRVGTFWWTTQVGLLPSNAIFAYAGAQLPTLRVLADQGPWQALTPRLITALIVLSVGPLLFVWIVHWLRRASQSRKRNGKSFTPPA